MRKDRNGFREILSIVVSRMHAHVRVIICFDARGGTCRVELSVIIACIRNCRHRHLLPLLHGKQL